MKTLTNYLTDGTAVILPDERLSARAVLDGRLSLHPTRGYAHSLVAMRDGRAVGWIGTDQLGFGSVREWMQSGDTLASVERAAKEGK